MTAQERFIPLSVPSLKGNEKKYVTECIETEWVSTAGSFVERFEKNIAQYSDSPYAVACSNGTAALHVSLLLAGVKPGDEVIVPTLTFIAPINCVRYVNAEPLFMDCDDYLNMDVGKLAEFLEKECAPSDGRLVNRRTGRRIGAIMVVHVFGHLADMDAIMALSERYGITVIEDATEALGSRFTSGRFKNRAAGTIAPFGAYSFNGNKIITTGGGGMLLTSDAEHARKAKYLTTQAKDDDVRYVHNEVGYNYRMTNVQAAMGVAQLEALDQYVQTKRSNFETYTRLLAEQPGISWIKEPAHCFSNYWFYSLVADGIESQAQLYALVDRLQAKRIQTRPIWLLNHLQKPYLGCQHYRIEKALRYSSRTINLPCSVNIAPEDIERVCKELRSELGGLKNVR